MTMEVETRNASIDTLAVTIRALHVSGKQMTLAVFRQLPTGRAYVDDGTLNPMYEHWGIVRYDIKGEGSVWVVASHDGRLYRCDAYPPYPIPVFLSEKAHYEAAVRERDRFLAYQRACEVVEFERAAYRTRKAAAEALHPEPTADSIEALLGRRRRMDAIEAACGEWPSSPDWPAGLSRTHKAEDYERNVESSARRLRLATVAEASRCRLFSLPQLFIAV